MKSFLGLILLSLLAYQQALPKTLSQKRGASSVAKAKKAISQKRYKEALHELNNSKSEPNAEKLDLLAKAYRGLKDTKNETRTLEVLHLLEPTKLSITEELGNAYIKSEQLDKAAETFRAILKEDKKYMAAYEGLYHIFSKTKNNYEQRTVLQDMQKAFGDNAVVYTKLCRFYSEDSFFEKSLEYCEKAIKKNPRVAENYIYAGLDYKGKGLSEKSRNLIHQAAKKFPKSELAQYTAGTQNLEMKNWESAKYYFHRCVRANKASDKCWNELAKVALSLKDYSTSLSAFTKACELNHEHYTEFRNAASTVKFQNKEKGWSDRFQSAVSRCGKEN